MSIVPCVAVATLPISEPQQSSQLCVLTFGHLIENHVDQDVGSTPAGAVAVNRRRDSVNTSHRPAAVEPLWGWRGRGEGTRALGTGHCVWCICFLFLHPLAKDGLNLVRKQRK